MSNSVRKIINTDNAPKPVAPYNQAVQVGNIVYLSGVLGLDKTSMKLVDGGAQGQTKQALINMGHILEAASSSFKNVIKTTIYLADIADFAAVNDVYKQFFEEPYPARSAFQVGKLPLDAKVEIEAIAAIGNIECAL